MCTFTENYSNFKMSEYRENQDMDIICPENLEGLVDAIQLCTLQVSHPLILRKGQRPPACGPGCNATLNLVKLTHELVTIVSSNANYVKILPWAYKVCSTTNIGTITCNECPYDPFKNNPLITLLSKHFTKFFKKLVALVSSNPPPNYIPSKITNFSLIKTILSCHGHHWQALLPLSNKLIPIWKCKPPPASPPTHSPEIDLLAEEEDDLLLLNCSTESLYEVE